MIIAELYQEIEHLPPADLDALAARVAVLRKSRMPGYVEEMTCRRDDQSSDGWISLDALKEQVGSSDSE